MKITTYLSMSLFLLFFPLTGASKNNPSRQPVLNKPMVLRIEGRATTTAKDVGKPIPLKKGDVWEIGSQIRTEINSRLVLTFGEGNQVRFDELTTSELVVHTLNNHNKDTIFNAISGNIWISIPTPATPPVSIVTTHAWIQSDQAIFRLSILPDGSILVKVYQGDVNVKKKKDTDGKEKTSRKPKMWFHILKPMQQIFIRPDGTSTNPFQLMIKPDRNSWVHWNQSLDKALLDSQSK